MPWSRGKIFAWCPGGPGSLPTYSSLSAASRLKKLPFLVTSQWKSTKEKKMTQFEPRPKWQWEMSLVLMSMLNNNVRLINQRDHRYVIQHNKKYINQMFTEYVSI